MIRKLLLCLLLVIPIGFFFYLRESGAKVDDYKVNQAAPLNQDQRLAIACLSIFPGQSFPAGIPWEAMRGIGQPQSQVLEELAKNKPIEFLQLCLNRYESDIHGYRCIFVKRERVKGVIPAKNEIIRVNYLHKPFSVHMEWLQGGRAFRSVYVEDENDGLLIAQFGFSFGPIFHKKVDADDVMATSRFPITKFGMYNGAVDTFEHIVKADKKKTLNLRFEGVVPVEEVGNRKCYKFVRTPYDPPEGDGVDHLTFYIDQENLMQVGSILKDREGNLIANYFFRDIELNPTFGPKQFTIKGK